MGLGLIPGFAYQVKFLGIIINLAAVIPHHTERPKVYQAQVLLFLY
jgi:hypothetical protein